MRTRPPRATPRVPDLPGEADRSSEEAVQRVHRPAHLEERVEELRARDLVVMEAPSGGEVLPPQVLDERMIRIVAGRGSLQRVSLDGDPASDDLLPRVRFVDDPIANLLQRRGVGMPDPRMGHRLARVHVKIVAGRHLLRPGRLRVPEMDSDLRLVRALVRREPDVPIDAGERPAEGFGFRDEIRANLLQPRSGVTNESQARFLYGVLVTFLVLRKPLFVVVLREVTEEPEELRGEVFRLLGHLAPPRRHRVSPVEHWRDWPRVEDGADRAVFVAAEPEEAPHARNIHARQDDLPTRPLDLRSRRIEVVDAHVARAPRDLFRLRRSDSALPTAGRPERKVVAHRELHGLEAPAEDPLEETSGRGRIGARKLGEGHRSVLA